MFEKTKNNEEEIKVFSQKVKIKKVPERIKEMLNLEISTEKIYETISATKLGKVPGPDGLTVNFFKLFKGQITLYLGEIMNGIMKGQEMPNTWKDVAIMLIPKEGLDEMEIKNYRPISLLNLDYKIFAGILAFRFKRYLVDFISNDQVSFFPERHLKDNLRVLLNVLEWAESQPSKKLGLVFIDAEKAFDKLEWDFLNGMLEEIEIGVEFLNAIRHIKIKII